MGMGFLTKDAELRISRTRSGANDKLEARLVLDNNSSFDLNFSRQVLQYVETDQTGEVASAAGVHPRLQVEAPKRRGLLNQLWGKILELRKSPERFISSNYEFYVSKRDFLVNYAGGWAEARTRGLLLAKKDVLYVRAEGDEGFVKQVYGLIKQEILPSEEKQGPKRA